MSRTSQRLQLRIKQHVPKIILQEHISQDRSILARSCKPIRNFKAETSFSAMRHHFLQNPTCARKYNDNKFSILASGRTSFHLSTFEATYIKTFKPNLCKQKKFGSFRVIGRTLIVGFESQLARALKERQCTLKG